MQCCFVLFPPLLITASFSGFRLHLKQNCCWSHFSQRCLGVTLHFIITHFLLFQVEHQWPIWHINNSSKENHCLTIMKQEAFLTLMFTGVQYFSRRRVLMGKPLEFRFSEAFSTMVSQRNFIFAIIFIIVSLCRVSPCCTTPRKVSLTAAWQKVSGTHYLMEGSLNGS